MNMRREWRVAAALTGGLLAQGPAIAAPSAEELAAAKDDCQTHRDRYEEMQANYQPPSTPNPTGGITASMLGPDELSREYDLWQQSCDYAKRLVREAKRRN